MSTFLLFVTALLAIALLRKAWRWYRFEFQRWELK